jgi:hypothetical protein
MTVHLYTLCWNDGPRLSFFFRHYDAIVDRYVIYDDGSDAATLDRLRAHPKVEIRRFERSDPNSFVLSELHISNQCWKESRDKANWVIVADIDELLWHADLAAYLARCTRDGITAIPALGIQMVDYRFPPEGTDLPANLKFPPITGNNRQGLTLKNAALASGFVTAIEFDEWVQPERMARP